MTVDLLAFVGLPGPMEMLIVGVIALLLFGNRLPSVARSLGMGISEFKKGASGIEDEDRRSTP
jgi:sec-independent protein translocase protein TatA